MPMRFSKQTRRSVVGFVTFVVILLFALRGFGLKPIHVTQNMFSKIGTAIGHTFTYVKSYDDFLSELKILRARVVSLSIETERVMELEQENRELRSMLSMTKEAPKNNIKIADVLTRSITDQRAQFVINVGSDDGVAEGYAVVVEDGIIVGIVENARRQTSIVRLITDQRSRVASRISDSDTIGVCEGKNGSLLALSFIPQHIKLDVNDMVLTSGLEDGIPQGLVVGLITEITGNDTDPFQSATVEPIVDFRMYQTIGVVMPTEEL